MKYWIMFGNRRIQWLEYEIRVYPNKNTDKHVKNVLRTCNFARCGKYGMDLCGILLYYETNYSLEDICICVDKFIDNEPAESIVWYTIKIMIEKYDYDAPILSTKLVSRVYNKINRCSEKNEHMLKLLEKIQNKMHDDNKNIK